MSTTGFRWWRPRSAWVVWGAVLATVAVRLPLLHLPAWPDEAGFLMVGGGWHLGDPGAGHSLYDAYWVDRPPVLVTIYGLAERLGGLVALRLIGAVAAALTVASVAWIAHSVAGSRAARWGAVTMAALLSTPFHWSFMVDGELVAISLVAAGVGSVIRGIASSGRRGLFYSGAGGVLAAAAILTKQNIADVFVFVVALLGISLLARSISFATAVRHASAFLAGVIGCGAVVAGWTLAHGTSLGAVFYAMYPFRVDAAAATSGTGTISWGRLTTMGTAALLSGLALLTIWVVLSGVRRRHRDVHVLALLVLLAFDLFSVASGTSYWLHYLLQPAVPVAALAGILVARGSFVRFVSCAAVVMALVGWVVLLASPPQTAEEMVGEAIAGSATAHDTLVTMPGHANVNYAAGLPSPYAYLWSLPARTLDPGGVRLQKLLSGPRAPTWLVSWSGARPHPRRPGTVAAAIADRYREAARICGRVVYVRKDVTRARPMVQPRADATRRSRCESVTVVPHLLRELS